MFKQLKTALVESFVGAIALGWVFSQAVLHFAYLFIAPFGAWIQRREYSALKGPTGFTFQDALPEVFRCIALLVVGYLLLRWLYYPSPDDGAATSPNSKGKDRN